MKEELKKEVIDLLKLLIETPSFSKEEDKTAALIEHYLIKKGVPFSRKINNIWAKNLYFDSNKPTILLNSHHDTVRPNPKWTKNPHEALVINDQLFGLGSNDAGGCLVSLLATFLFFYEQPNLQYNFLFVASAEEEITGANGLELLLKENLLPKIDFAIVGEPTQMDLAIAEKGLMVLECTAHGKAGHAARNEGENALYIALEDINWIRNYQFQEISELLGPVKMTVTIINSGSQHNVVPDKCNFTIDVRATEKYSLDQILETIKANIKSEVAPKSMRLKPSSIPANHPIVKAGLALGCKTYGSPTTSDQAVLNCPSLKMGPGDSARSHTADEYIYLSEIENGIDIYIKMLQTIV